MVNKYTLKIPQELADHFQNFIDEHPELGYKYVSQYCLQILRDKAAELPRAGMKPKSLTLKSGTYTKEDLERLFKNSE